MGAKPSLNCMIGKMKEVRRQRDEKGRQWREGEVDWYTISCRRPVLYLLE
jgi:hypothetical protein